MDKIWLRSASHSLVGLVWAALVVGQAAAQTSTSTPTATPTPTATATPTNTPPAVANDLCGTATTIFFSPFTETVSTLLATSVSDPAPSCGNHSAAKSIWYKFTAPSSGTVNAYTLGSNYDTILSAFTGTCGALVQVGCNDDAFLTLQSKLPLAVIGGTTYFFMVSASTGTGGSSQFTLTFEPSPAATATVGASTPTRTPTSTFTTVPGATNTLTPTAGATLTRTATPSVPNGNDACNNAIVIPSAPYTNIVNTSAATMEAGDPQPGCGNNSREKTVWYRFTAPSNGILTADTLGSDYDTILSSFTGTCGAFTGVTGGCNDDAPGSSQSQVSFIATGGTTYSFMVSAYSGNGGNLIFHLMFQGGAVTGTQSPSLTPTQTPTSTQTFTSIPGATNTPTPTGPAAPTNTSTVTPTSGGGLPNDTCSTATTIASAPYTNIVNTSTATMEAGDPQPGCGNNSRQKTVWYRFTAPSAGILTADTFGSSYDTILSAQTGACGAFTGVTGGCNDDAPGSSQSQVSFIAAGGTTYFFMVSAYNGDGGTLVFHLMFQGVSVTGTQSPSLTPTQTPTSTQTFTSIPGATSTPTRTGSAVPTNTATVTPTSGGGLPNDTCGTATNIASAPYTNIVNTSTATMEAADPQPGCGNNSRQKTVWYRFTAPSAGIVTADTLGSSYDTHSLVVQTGACGAFSGVTGGCNDDAPGSSQSQVSFTATGWDDVLLHGQCLQRRRRHADLPPGVPGDQLADANAIPNAHPHADADANDYANRYADRDGHAHAYDHADVYDHPNVDDHADLYDYADGDAHADDHANRDDHPDGDNYTDGDAARLLRRHWRFRTTFVAPRRWWRACRSSTTRRRSLHPLTSPTRLRVAGISSKAKSVWYRFTAPSTGTVTASTLGSNYDTILAAYTGSCGSLNETQCNDDAPGVSQSQVSFAATGGTTYLFMVTAYTGNGGNLTFNLSFAP